jgi:hypothetical protein
MAMYNYTPNTNYYGANETEEERRRREEQQMAADDAARLANIQMPAPPMVEQAGVAVAPVAPEPIKQTITYDPVSGEQRMKIEGNARDLSAENPLTPTLTMPGSVSPEQIDQQQQMEMAAQQREREAQAQMAQQQMPQAQVPEPQQQMPMPQLPEPGPGVQVAGPAQMPPQAQPYTGPGQGEEAQTVGQSQFAPTPAQQPVQKTPMDVFAEAAGDTSKLLQIYNDKNQSPELRRMAGREAGRMLDAETKRVEAEENVKNMSQSDIARMLRSKDEEGSWGKRVLFGLLNMQAAMAQEDAKLGIGAKYQSTSVNGTPVLVKVRADGKPMEGFDATTGKQLNNKELVAAVAQMTAVKGTEVEAGTYLDPTGKVPGNWVLERRPGGSVYRQVGTGAIATESQANALRKTGVQGTLGDQRARLIQEANIKLQGKAGEEAMAIQRQFNQLLIGQGLAPMQPGETPIIAPQIGGTAPSTAAQAAPAAPALAPDQIRRLQGDLAAVDSELSRLPANDSRRQIIQTERDKIVQQLGGVPAALPTGRRPTQQQLEAQGVATTEAAKTAPLVRREDEQSFVKYKNDDILPKADTGARLAGIRRDQISGPDGVLNNPEIAGLLSGTGGAAREFQNIFRDIVGGNFDKVDDMSTRIKSAGLDDRMKQVLQVQLQRQREVTPLLIREVAPVGAITDFEQRMAKEAGIDVLRQGLYASLTNLTRSQFQSDMAAYKSVFAERNPQLRTRAEFDRAWNAEKSRLDASYRQVYTDRAKYLGQYNRDGSNNNATIVAFRDHYPVPAFDQSTGQFRFNGFSRQAERAPLSSFERR